MDTSDAARLDFLQQRSNQDVNLQDLNQLVRHPGSDNFAKREKASAQLFSIGLRALPALRGTMADTDQEVANRAKKCIEKIERDSNGGTPSTIVRLMQRRPDGSGEALLQYLS